MRRSLITLIMSLCLALCAAPVGTLASENLAKDFIPNEFTVIKGRSINGMHVLRYQSLTDQVTISDITVNRGKCRPVFVRYPLQITSHAPAEVYVDCEPFSVKTTTLNKDYLKVFPNY
jgi:hypothetical protein